MIPVRVMTIDNYSLLVSGKERVEAVEPLQHTMYLKFCQKPCMWNELKAFGEINEYTVSTKVVTQSFCSVMNS